MKQIFSENKIYFILIFLLAVIFYIPTFIYPDLLLKRGNDLSEFFWPIIYFAKTQILDSKNLPLWNNLFFSGMPLLPDPQSPLFYLPNIIFLFLPIDIGFIFSIFIHTIFGGLGAFFCSRYGLKFTTKTSFFIAAIFITSPKLAGYIEAGHFGLITSFNWLPYLFLSLIKISKFPNIRWMTLLSISLSQIFFTHIITFLISLISSFIFFAVYTTSMKELRKSFIYFFLSLVITLGFISITLLPQLEWSGETTRFLLIKNPDVYPKWQSLKEFILPTFFPWWNFSDYINSDSEKWLSIGFLILPLSILGFFFLKTKIKILILFFSIVIILISLNNISPIVNLLNSSNLYKLIRVATRIWFIEVFIIIFLAGWGIEVLFAKLKEHFHFIIYFVIFLILIENFTLSWSRIFLKPISKPDFVQIQVYDFLQNDRGRFRVFCLNRCLSQQESAQRKIELVEGYDTLQQYNYYQESWQFTNSFWDYYTLSIPPISVYTFKKIHPDAKALGDYNVKYIISPYVLDNESLLLRGKFGNYFLYQNNKFKPRAYILENNGEFFKEAKIIQYSPNLIRVDTSSFSKNLILSEVYNKQWVAFLNGKEKVNVQETPNRLRLVDITDATKFVDFKYQPRSFTVGIIVTLSTTIIVILINIWKRNKKYF